MSKKPLTPSEKPVPKCLYCGGKPEGTFNFLNETKRVECGTCGIKVISFDTGTDQEVWDMWIKKNTIEEKKEFVQKKVLVRMERPTLENMVRK